LGTRCLALFHQLPRDLVGLNSLIRLGKGAETDEIQHLSDLPGRLVAGDIAAIRCSNQLEHLSHSTRRVEVIRQRVPKAIETGDGGGLAGASMLLLRRVLPRLTPST